MNISIEKLNKIKEFKDDYSELFLKLYDYYNEKYELICKNKVFNTYNEIKENGFNILFSNDNIIETNLIKIQSNIEDIEFQINEIVDNIKTEKATVIIDMNSVSTIPIWNTVMRRYTTKVMENFQNIDLQDITQSSIKNILFNTKIPEISDNKEYSLDFLIKFITELSKKIKIKVLYIMKKSTSEYLFFINEFEKFLNALSMENKKRNEFIYDTVCYDMDTMFSKYGFCNFKKSKCFSQRHKNVFNNRYPVPRVAGCCFKIINKCEHNNKDGTCRVQCLACKLFTCPYLSKFNIGIRTSEVLLIRAFFNNKQKRTAIYEFYKPKEYILNKIQKYENYI